MPSIERQWYDDPDGKYLAVMREADQLLASGKIDRSAYATMSRAAAASRRRAKQARRMR